MTELQNCPFCGSSETFISECEDEAAGFSTFWGECDECCARGSISEYKDGAMAYWNKAAKPLAEDEHTIARRLKTCCDKRELPTWAEIGYAADALLSRHPGEPTP